MSKLMNWVMSGHGHSDADTNKELDPVSKVRQAEREAAEKQLAQWENENLFTSGVKDQIASMWEVSAIVCCILTLV